MTEEQVTKHILQWLIDNDYAELCEDSIDDLDKLFFHASSY